MSKGLSKQQVVILGLLCGTEASKIFGGSCATTTPEIVDELVKRDMLDWQRPRRQQVATVRRACISLLGRGLVTGTYRKGFGADESSVPHWGHHLEWEATDAGRELAKSHKQAREKP